MPKSVLAYLTLLTAGVLPLFADLSQGEKLEIQMWEDMKHRNFTAVESKIAADFQSVHTFGALKRDAEIELIKNLYLGSYQISDMYVTEVGETLVVSYLISVKEKIENKQLSDKPAPRMSIWQKINGQWQWIAHANLKEIPLDLPKTEPIEKSKKVIQSDKK